MIMMASLSKRLRMRRKPLSERNSRSISLRRRHQAFLTVHGFDAKRMRRNERDQLEIERQPLRFVVLIRRVHDQSAALGQFLEVTHQLAPSRYVARLAERQRESAMAHRAYPATT